jgi:ABC-type polysaccharide/polyol phosphate export permease
MYHIVDLIRAPLLGVPMTALSYGMIGIIAIIGLFAFNYLMNKSKYRIIFWL